MFVFTLCSNNYLAQAIVLGKSLKHYNPDVEFNIGLIDKKNEKINYNNLPFEIIEVEEIGIPNFNEMVERYNITELNTAVKPFYFNYFWNKFEKKDVIIYLDPDICIYSKFDDLNEQLNTYDIVLTPHCTHPINDDKLPTENNFLNAGLYNLGFLAIQKSKNAKEMINWWADRLIDRAFNDFEKGMFTDQLWMNFTPLFFKKVLVYKNFGYNMAYWNLHERTLSTTLNSNFVNETNPLVFFHFSGYNPLKPDVISKYQNRFSFNNRAELVKLFEDYKKQLFDHGYFDYISNKCVYVEIKENLEKGKRNLKLKKMPLFKRTVRSTILRTIKILKIEL